MLDIGMTCACCVRCAARRKRILTCASNLFMSTHEKARSPIRSLLQDWHMLHANEAWRQLTGAELQKGVSTGLWESFEFLSAQAQVELFWPCTCCR